MKTQNRQLVAIWTIVAICVAVMVGMFFMFF